MPIAKRRNSPQKPANSIRKNPGWKLPTTRRAPVSNPWRYAYLLAGEKKIGKTSFAIEGCDEYVIQLDKPQLAYEIMEDIPKSWRELVMILKALEESAEAGKFPYQRIIVDGIGEAYAMCQEFTCKHFSVEHPSDVGFAKAWHFLRDNFTEWVNRLLRLQQTADCGVVFISHAEWKEVKLRGGETIEKFCPNLAGKCEEVVNGKVDAWFIYDYIGKDRVLIVQGDQETGAGHRIDGHFLTPEGERVREVYMGQNPAEALANFIKAFENKWPYVDYASWKKAHIPKTETPQRRSSRGKK